MSKIFAYRNEKAWVETMDYIDDLPSKYALNQKVKAEDIPRFQRELYRYTALKNEKKLYKKICYTDWVLYKRLTSKQKNYVLFLKKGFNTRQVDIKKIPAGLRFYVTWYYQKNKNKIFLRHAKFLGSEFVVRSRIHNISRLKYIYNYVIENDVKDYNLTKEDIYIPDFSGSRKNSFRVKGANFIFYNQNNVTDLIKPREDIFNTGIETSEIKEKDFIDPQIEVVENILRKKTTEIFNELFFLYDKSNIVKKQFLTKLNKFLSIFGPTTFLGSVKTVFC